MRDRVKAAELCLKVFSIFCSFGGKSQQYFAYTGGRMCLVLVERMLNL